MRYVSWVQIDQEGDVVQPEQGRSGMTVFEAEGMAEDTGLIDKDGNPIMRVSDPLRVGFVRFGD